MNLQPPENAHRFLRWFCHPKFIDEVEWDLEELFEENCKRHGHRIARNRYWVDVLKHFQPFFIRSISHSFSTQNKTAMWSNYLKIAIRNFSRHKVFSLINLSGLALGMASCLIILQYAYHEMTYDSFHEKKDSIYRVQQDIYRQNELTTRLAAGCAAIGPAINASIPEVVNYVKLRRNNATISYNNIIYRESRLFYVSDSFFEIFSYDLLQGVDSLVLNGPYKMAISESTAKKYFGDADPMGKIMRRNGFNDFTVTGVFADSPENTHLKADVLLSFDTYVLFNGENAENSWDWSGFWTYIELEKEVDKKLVEEKITDFHEGVRGEVLRENNFWETFNLQPVGDIHLHSNYMQEFEVNGNVSIVYGSLVIAAFILVIALFNFISLSTSRAMQRAREIGVRKVMGSNKTQLVSQFLMESVLLNFLAAGIALLITVLVLPYFESLAGKSLSPGVFQEYKFWILFPTTVMISALLSSLYPALIMSRYKCTTIISGRFKSTYKGQILRKSIVVFQFMISVILITSTLVVYNQIRHMQQMNLDINIDDTLVVQGAQNEKPSYLSTYQAFKTELLQNPVIKNISTSSDVPGGMPSTDHAPNVRREGTPETDGVNLRLIEIDDDFVSSYQLKIVTGRDFSKDRNTTYPPILINEKGAEYIGFENAEAAVGQKIQYGNRGRYFEIVGVLKNYHQESPKSDFEPIICRFLGESDSPWRNLLSIKVDEKSTNEAISLVEKTFGKFFPGEPFDYYFLDTRYQQQYQAEVLFNRLFNLFSGLAIFITCLGLLGLSTHTILQKMKEVGIRKVLGANVREIMILLSSEFTRLITIALIIGLPVSWFMMDRWLSDFAFRISMSWWLFLIPVIALFTIAALTIYYQMYKAAITNSVEILKDE